MEVENGVASLTGLEHITAKSQNKILNSLPVLACNNIGVSVLLLVDAVKEVFAIVEGLAGRLTSVYKHGIDPLIPALRL